MKKLIIITFISLLGLGVNAQYIRKVNDSTYKIISDIPAGTITRTDGSKVPVYQTAKGKLYYYRISPKTGRLYKSYLKPIN